MYRTLGIHQNKGTTCVVDYYQRLALGAAGYSGSSLQSYMFEREDFSTGKKTLSIPRYSSPTISRYPRIPFGTVSGVITTVV